MGDTDNTASAQVIRLLSKATLKHVKMDREIDYTDTIGLGRFVAQSSKILIFINLLENNTRQLVYYIHYVHNDSNQNLNFEIVLYNSSLFVLNFQNYDCDQLCLKLEDTPKLTEVPNLATLFLRVSYWQDFVDNCDYFKIQFGKISL